MLTISNIAAASHVLLKPEGNISHHRDYVKPVLGLGSTIDTRLMVNRGVNYKKMKQGLWYCSHLPFYDLTHFESLFLC